MHLLAQIALPKERIRFCLDRLWHVLSYGGGLVRGDEVKFEITVGEAAS